jgi:hypothetical protein
MVVKVIDRATFFSAVNGSLGECVLLVAHKHEEDCEACPPTSEMFEDVSEQFEVDFFLYLIPEKHDLELKRVAEITYYPYLLYIGEDSKRDNFQVLTKDNELLPSDRTRRPEDVIAWLSDLI